MDVPPFPVDRQMLAERLQATAEPTRLLILHLIMEGLQCNCEFGEALGMAPNLVSHHLRVLRDSGLVEASRDELDARWVYYSINRAALDELNQLFSAFFDPARIKPRRHSCGPKGALAALDELVTDRQTSVASEDLEVLT